MSRYLLTIVLLCAIASVRAGAVEVDYDTSADFSRFTYYQWQEQSDNVEQMFATLGSGNIQDALTPSLDQKASAATAEHPADFLVRYYIREFKQPVDDRPRVGVGIGGGSGNVGGGFSFSFPLGANDLDKQAHVVIDFLDAKTKKLVWRGSVVTGMSSTSTEINQRQAQKAAAEILKKFPPK
jgi:hypothetical protein